MATKECNKKNSFMRKLFICLILLFIFSSMTGCYFRSKEKKKYQFYIGKHVRTKVDLALPSDFASSLQTAVAFPLDKYVKSAYKLVPMGSMLNITGISSRRIESGKWYYLEFEYDENGTVIVFDYPISQRYINKLNFDETALD